MDQQTLTRVQLYNLVWLDPLLTLSKKYDMSDVGLRKLCVRMEIPIPRSGHWQQVRAGRKVKIPTLSLVYTGKETVTLSFRKDKSNELSELDRLREEIENDPRVNLEAPKRLTNPHMLIIAARNDLQDNRSSARYRLLYTSRDHLKITTSKEKVGQSLRFMDALIKALYARGHSVEAYDSHNNVVIHNERIGISFREKSKRVITSDSSHPSQSAEFQPSGILSFHIEDYNHHEWKDNKQPLEEQLSKIIARLELEGKRLLKVTLRRKKEKEEEEREKRIKDELEKRKQTERDNFRILLNDADRWHQASILRSFLSAIPGRQNADDKLVVWLDWAQKKLAWFDPFIGANDELFTDEDLRIFKKCKFAQAQRSTYLNW